MMSWPASSSIGAWSRSIAVRISGPFVSSIAAAILPFWSHTRRKRSSTSPWLLWSPWLKLKRAMFMPLSSSLPSMSSVLHLGPSVHTIFVLRL